MSDLTGDLPLTSYRAFVRKARQAAHQSLYFLYHLGDWPGRLTDQPVVEFRPFALTQVRAMVLALHVPGSPDGPGGTFAKPADVIASWRRILKRLTPDEPNDLTPADPNGPDTDKLRREVEQFLQDSRATGWGYVNHQRDNIQRYLGKQSATLATGILVLVGLFAPEQIRNLLIYGNRLGLGIVPFALLGILVNIGLGFRFGILRIGRRAFWQPWKQAVEPESGIARWPSGSRLRSQIAAGLLIKVGLAVVVQGVGFALLFGGPASMYGSRTAGVTVSLASVIVVLAHVVDRWDFMDDRPTRLMTIGGALGCAACAWLGGRGAAIAFLLVVAVGLHFFQTRKSTGPGQAPPSPRWIPWFFSTVYVVMSAMLIVGGISNKKGVWRVGETHDATARGISSTTQKTPAPGQSGTPLRCGEWPYPHDSAYPAVVVAASGGGSRAAIYTALTLAALPEELRVHLQAISSVSGGSLANAAYIQQRRRMKGLRTALPREVPLDNADPGDALVRSVSEDFLWPTLTGAACPVIGRGASLERQWESFLGNDGIATLAQDWTDSINKQDTQPPFPVPLFNSCTLDGHALVISPLNPDYYRKKTAVVPDMKGLYPKKTLTNVFDRDGIYALEDLLESFDLPLTSAVRASANFPFGFPLISIITTPDHLRYSPKTTVAKEVEVNLTDGGVLSNSGMWSLYNLLMKDGDVVERLKRRGALLILVEASKMPSVNETIHKTLALGDQITDKGPKGQRLHRMMFENLQRAYGPLLKILQVDLEPTENFNVGTTWALDTESTRRLRKTFDTQGRQELEPALDLFNQVREAAKNYHGRDTAAASPKAPPQEFARPPID